MAPRRRDVRMSKISSVNPVRLLGERDKPDRHVDADDRDSRVDPVLHDLQVALDAAALPFRAPRLRARLPYKALPAPARPVIVPPNMLSTATAPLPPNSRPPCLARRACLPRPPSPRSPCKKGIGGEPKVSFAHRIVPIATMPGASCWRAERRGATAPGPSVP